MIARMERTTSRVMLGLQVGCGPMVLPLCDTADPDDAKLRSLLTGIHPLELKGSSRATRAVPSSLGPVSSRGQDTWFSATGPGFESPYRYQPSLRVHAKVAIQRAHSTDRRSFRCGDRDRRRVPSSRLRTLPCSPAPALPSHNRFCDEGHSRPTARHGHTELRP